MARGLAFMEVMEQCDEIENKKAIRYARFADCNLFPPFSDAHTGSKIPPFALQIS
jgi:hypothetical protein